MFVYQSGKLVAGGGGPAMPSVVIEFGDCILVADGMPPALVT